MKSQALSSRARIVAKIASLAMVGACSAEGSTTVKDTGADQSTPASVDAAIDSGTDGSKGRTSDSSCASGSCADAACRDGSCDAARPIPCGVADAMACASGKACTTNEMCASFVCAAGPVLADNLDGGSDGGSGFDGGSGGGGGSGSGAEKTCQPATPHDGVQNDSETDIDCGGRYLDDLGTSNPASDGAPSCQYALSQLCKLGSDCDEGVCNDSAGAGAGPIDCPAATVCTCQAPSPTDGVHNDSETDVDCGGGAAVASDGAPACGDGLHCLVGGDCTSLVCQGATAASSGQPAVLGTCAQASCSDGVKNGGETDVDCGGMMCSPCPVGEICLVGTDCASNGCDYTNHCALAPSCAQHHGGDTCGLGEDIGPAPTPTTYESCCTSLEVPGYTEPGFEGKTVYLDKYEITAGRMRAFVTYVESLYAGEPDIYDYTRANVPLTWNPGWESVLPSNTGSSTEATVDSFSFTVGQPALLYPTSVAAPNPANWVVGPGTYMINPGLENVLGPVPYFPEWWDSSSGPGTHYGEFHNFNCTNDSGSYGFGTYWFDGTKANPGTAQDADSASRGKNWSQDELDEKALNCTPFGLFAAFCAWDGGQLMTNGVYNTVMASVSLPPPSNPQTTPDCQDGIISVWNEADGGCDSVYYYPYDNSGQGWDNSAIVAPPGRVKNDVVTLAGGAGPWHDLRGNLLEAFYIPKTGAFGHGGGGLGYFSVTFHNTQETTPRMKAASFGARCMRLR